MLDVVMSSQFKQDLKLCRKRHLDMALLENVVDILMVPEKLPEKNKDHTLSGKYNRRRECHIQPDWLLIYRVTDTELMLDRTGTHSDLF